MGLVDESRAGEVLVIHDSSLEEVEERKKGYNRCSWVWQSLAELTS